MTSRTETVDPIPAQLIERALQRGEAHLTQTGALYTTTGRRTGRSPADRYIVKDATTDNAVDWGVVNQPIDAERFNALWRRVVDYLADRERFTGHWHVGADKRFYLPLTLTTETAWHSLFASNMFIAPKRFNPADKPVWQVLHAADFICDPVRDGTNDDGCVIIDFTQRKVLLAGMSYAGELKKAMFSVQNFLLTERDVLPMHCAANVSVERDGDSDTCLFFGLSGTGKTTLSADSRRLLIGDDEHGWAKGRVFNFEGGCYAKTVDLSPENEPVIYRAIRYGAILENVAVDPDTRDPDYSDTRHSENGRASYPLAHIVNRVVDNHSGEPARVIFLTCDITGVLPPVSVLSKEAAAYHFLSGYTAKVASTEQSASGDTGGSIQPTFSACFGAPFMPRPATVYAELLMRRIEAFGSQVFLVNTGWCGGAGGRDGTGTRFPIPVTRALVSAIQSGELDALSPGDCEWIPVINLTVPKQVSGIDPDLLVPARAWPSEQDWRAHAEHLANLFRHNMQRFDPGEEILAAGPVSL